MVITSPQRARFVIEFTNSFSTSATKVMSDKQSYENWAQLILQSKWAPYILPPLIFILCWNLQTTLTLLVGMAINGGYFIISLVHGARITSFFLFGFRAVIGMTAGVLPYFYLFPDPNDGEVFNQFALQNVIYSLVVYATVEMVIRARKLSDEYDGYRHADMFWMIGISSVACSLIKPTLVAYQGGLSTFAMITFQSAGRIVGSLVVLYVAMFALSLLQNVKIDARSSS